MRPRLPRASLLRRLAVGAAMAAAGCALASCASARDDLGTGNSACFVAVPAAVAAVHHHGHLSGVRLVSVGSLRSRAPHLYHLATSRDPGARQVCLVAFTGEFRRSDLTGGAGRSLGGVAVVELAYPGHRVVGTLVLLRSPLVFGHSHLGLL